jgi:hypothetical protein
MPRIIFIGDKDSQSEIKVGKITYTVFVDNIDAKQEYPSNTLAKCPELGNRNMKNFTITHYES